MREIVIKPLAKQDIKNIWQYSFKNWGRTQANHYMEHLGKSINALIDNPERGHSIDHVSKSYRQYNVNEHLVIYRIRKNVIEIVRVLGKRMDLSRHV